jgi:hypothetical protein
VALGVVFALASLVSVGTAALATFNIDVDACVGSAFVAKNTLCDGAFCVAAKGAITGGVAAGDCDDFDGDACSGGALDEGTLTTGTSSSSSSPVEITAFDISFAVVSSPAGATFARARCFFHSE